MQHHFLDIFAKKQPTQQPVTKCVSCVHRHDDSHDCTRHRCVMSERGGRVVVHECDGYKAAEVVEVVRV